MKYTVMVIEESSTIYEQIIESDSGLVKKVVRAVLEYTPSKLK